MNSDRINSAELTTVTIPLSSPLPQLEAGQPSSLRSQLGVGSFLGDVQQCYVCGKIFMSAPHLLRHLQKEHDVENSTVDCLLPCDLTDIEPSGQPLETVNTHATSTAINCESTTCHVCLETCTSVAGGEEHCRLQAQHPLPESDLEQAERRRVSRRVTRPPRKYQEDFIRLQVTERGDDEESDGEQERMKKRPRGRPPTKKYQQLATFKSQVESVPLPSDYSGMVAGQLLTTETMPVRRGRGRPRKSARPNKTVTSLDSFTSRNKLDQSQPEWCNRIKTAGPQMEELGLLSTLVVVENVTRECFAGNAESKQCVTQPCDPTQKEIKHKKPLFERLPGSGQRVYRCGVKYCKYSNVNCYFMTKKELDIHSQCHTHDRANPFKCLACDFTHSQWLPMRRHLWKLHAIEAGILECGICGFKAEKWFLYQDHVKVHGDSYDHKCSKCDKMFKSYRFMRNHRRKHELAERREKERQELKPQIHTCDSCSFRTKDANSMNHHLNIHNGVKPFKCKHCSFATTHQSSLRHHLRRHDGVRPYLCPYCSWNTTEATPFRMHLIKCHPDNSVVHHCSFNTCSFSTLNEDYLARHLRTKHSGVTDDGSETRRSSITHDKSRAKRESAAVREGALKENMQDDVVQDDTANRTPDTTMSHDSVILVAKRPSPESDSQMAKSPPPDPATQTAKISPTDSEIQSAKIPPDKDIQPTKKLLCPANKMISSLPITDTRKASMPPKHTAEQMSCQIGNGQAEPVIQIITLSPNSYTATMLSDALPGMPAATETACRQTTAHTIPQTLTCLTPSHNQTTLLATTPHVTPGAHMITLQQQQDHPVACHAFSTTVVPAAPVPQHESVSQTITLPDGEQLELTPSQFEQILAYQTVDSEKDLLTNCSEYSGQNPLTNMVINTINF